MSRLTHLFVLLCVVLLLASPSLLVRASDSDSDSDSGVDVDVDVDAEAEHTAEVHAHHETLVDAEHEVELDSDKPTKGAATGAAAAGAAAATGRAAPTASATGANKQPKAKKPKGVKRAVRKPAVKVPTSQRCANVTDISQYRVVVPLFNAFIARHKRNYTTAKYNSRLCVYATRVQKLLDHNARFRKGLETYSIALTKLADVTKEETAARYKGLQLPASLESKIVAKEAPNPLYGRIKHLNIQLKPKATSSAKGAKAKRFMFRQKALDAAVAEEGAPVDGVGSTLCVMKGGECYDMNEFQCGEGTTPQRGLCPGPANIKCCLPDEKKNIVVAPTEFTGTTTLYDWSKTDILNWVTKGFTTPVQNQEQCGSCWAFAAAGAVEGWLWRKTGDLTPVSAQAFLDCTNGFGKATPGPQFDTCQGGWYHRALNWARANGANRARDYSYWNAKMQCKYDPANNMLKANPLTKEVPSFKTNCADVLKALEQGPLAIAMESNDPKFSLYGGGLYVPERTIGKPDHAMLMVGHGAVNGVKYAIIKNQWGEFWGEKGFLRVPLETLNVCEYAAYIY